MKSIVGLSGYERRDISVRWWSMEQVRGVELPGLAAASADVDDFPNGEGSSESNEIGSTSAESKLRRWHGWCRG